MYSHNGKYYLLSGVGNDGYIVSAYPIKEKEAIKLIRRYGKWIQKKQEIKIQLDYLQRPIWISDVATGEPLTGINIIDTDVILKDLNYRVAQLYSSYFEFNTHGVPCRYNHEQEKADKNIMIDLITKLINRLNEINDGSFVIHDFETDRLNNL